MEHTLSELKELQALPLADKIEMTKERIKAWVDHFGEDGVYVSFSGGKDSTVLLDIARQEFPNMKAMFVDVPTQYPELKAFAISFENVDVVKPRISFVEVCSRYGFPLISKEIANKMSDWKTSHDKGNRSYVDEQFEGVYVSKNGKSNLVDIQKYSYLKNAKFSLSHKCCSVMKKEPAHNYTKRTNSYGITAQMAEESMLRAQVWVKNGCNMFHTKTPISNPMSFWVEQDVLLYIKQNSLPICSVYGEIVEDWESTEDVEGQLTISDLVGFEDMKTFDAKRPLLKTTGCNRTGCMLCGFGCHLEKSPNRFELLKETHPGMYRLLDVVKNNGVTMREAIDWINEHGNMNIKY